MTRLPGLVVRDLHKHFGGVKAVNGVGFEVSPGECVALIGPNGAGKSTCFACVAGQHTPTAGSVQWAGVDITRFSPAQRLRAGVGRTFQVAQVFEALTVLQNIEQTMPMNVGQSAKKALFLLEKAGLMGFEQLAAGLLPYGAKKKLELAMALATEPGLLLLDEPAAGLALPERAAMMCWVKEVAAQGCAVLYTEHNMDAVFGVADRVLVLIDGVLVANGTPQEVRHDATVQKRYLGQGQAPGHELSQAPVHGHGGVNA